MSAFGFSVGDVLTGIGIALKIIQALRSSNTAVDQLTETLAFLESVKYTLRQVEECYPTAGEEAKVHVDAAVSSCRKRISDFVRRLENYRSLTRPPGSAGIGRMSAGRLQAFKGFVKVKWVFAVKDDLAALRASISSELLVLEMFVQMAEMEQALRTAQKQEILLERTERMEENITRLVTVMDIEEVGVAATEKMVEDLDADGKMMKCEEQSIWTGSDASTGVASARQSERLWAAAPSPVFIALCCYIWQLAQRRSMKFLPRGPSWSLDSNIQIQDALGRSMSLPYQYFKDWPVLLAKLQVDFDGLPGELKVKRRNFCLQLAHGSQFEVDGTIWSRFALPGAKFIMAMRVKGGRDSRDDCPRCGNLVGWQGHFNWSTCIKCGLQHQGREVYRSVLPPLPAFELETSVKEPSEAISDLEIQRREDEEEYDIFAFKSVQWILHDCRRCGTPFRWYESYRKHVDHCHQG